MAEWSSAQLDLLEDALEDLEQDGALERWLEDEPSPVLRERLEDYRSILLATRDAMPLEEVPVGLLDDVIEQARRSAPKPVARDGWWTRIRRSVLVPVVALAGTAMLVLWIGQPEDVKVSEGPAEPGRAPSPEAAAAANEDQLEQKAEDRTATPADAPASEATPQAPAAVVPEPSVAEPEEEITAELGAAAPKEDKKDEGAKAADDEANRYKGVAGGMSSLGDVPGGAPKKPAGNSGPASGRWDLIAEGDRARLAGDCVSARESYSVALEDDEATVRARAFAGMGLCDADMGQEAAADANYERARELDGGIDSFIDSQERKPTSAGKSRKKAKPTSKSKNAIDLDQAADPFQ